MENDDRVSNESSDQGSAVNEQPVVDASPKQRPPRMTPPPYVLDNHGGIVLDPSSALKLKDEQLRPTLYVGSSLLVRTTDLKNVLNEKFLAALEDQKLSYTTEDTDPELAEIARTHGLSDLADELGMTRIVLAPADPKSAAPPPDAFKVLQQYRASLPEQERNAAKLTLDHLLTADGVITGAPFMGTPFMGTPFMGTPFMGTPFMGTPFMGTGNPSVEYAMPGRGGRTPVVWLGAEPEWRHKSKLGCRNPVVAVLDTGCAEHWWLPDTIVDRHAKVVENGTEAIGLHHDRYNGDRHGSVNAPWIGTLDSDAGHGTFIAGLIRQTCPDARILAISVMRGDGTVPESNFLKSLNRLVLRQQIAINEKKPDMLIDVVSLSLGYYHELVSDLAMDHKILTPLRKLGELGVAVVVAAGNDSTDRPFYPAAFSPHDGSKLPKDHERLPLVSVGSLNPDDKIESLYSNAGDWVTTWRQGSSLVSTYPHFDGSAQPTIEHRVPRQGAWVRRGTIDPDDFRSGFATWSGTSFAAPVLAGQIAQTLLASNKLDKEGVSEALDRAWPAITKQAGVARPPAGP